ncbi:hypothetical protein SK128_004274, partial [Halocaridina rubra]
VTMRYGIGRGLPHGMARNSHHELREILTKEVAGRSNDGMVESPYPSSHTFIEDSLHGLTANSDSSDYFNNKNARTLTGRIGNASSFKDPAFHQCQFCPYRTLIRTNLVNHVRTHTGEKPYKCSYCPYRFKQKIALEWHLMTHTGEKPYKCQHCPYKTTKKSNFDLHITSQHPSVL